MVKDCSKTVYLYHSAFIVAKCVFITNMQVHAYITGFQVALEVKNMPANAGGIKDTGLIPGSGRSPREGRGNALHYSCLEYPMDRGAWWATFIGLQRIGHD